MWDVQTDGHWLLYVACQDLFCSFKRNGFICVCVHTATLRMSGSLQKSAEVMKGMQELVKVSDVAASMREMSREMMKVTVFDTTNTRNSKTKFEVCVLQLSASSSALLQLSRHFPPAPQDSLLPASFFIPLGTSLLAPQIQHLLTLSTFIYFISLLNVIFVECSFAQLSCVVVANVLFYAPTT